jgi:hypothetical protein
VSCCTVFLCDTVIFAFSCTQKCVTLSVKRRNLSRQSRSSKTCCLHGVYSPPCSCSIAASRDDKIHALILTILHYIGFDVGAEVSGVSSVVHNPMHALEMQRGRGSHKSRQLTNAIEDIIAGLFHHMHELTGTTSILTPSFRTQWTSSSSSKYFPW